MSARDGKSSQGGKGGSGGSGGSGGKGAKGGGGSKEVQKQIDQPAHEQAPPISVTDEMGTLVDGKRYLVLQRFAVVDGVEQAEFLYAENVPGAEKLHFIAETLSSSKKAKTESTSKQSAHVPGTPFRKFSMNDRLDRPHRNLRTIDYDEEGNHQPNESGDGRLAHVIALHDKHASSQVMQSMDWDSAKKAMDKHMFPHGNKTEVRTSSISGAGQGLFAEEDLQPGDTLGNITCTTLRNLKGQMVRYMSDVP